MGGVGAKSATWAALAPLNHEVAIHLFGKDWGLFGTQGIMLGGATYDVGVMVMFLFQMVFMDTALTIVTGTAAERWKYSAFIISSFVMGAFTYPLYANWAWGGGWLSTLGSSYGLGHGYADFAGSGVVHAVGGITALAMAIIIGPRIGKFTRDGTPNAIPGHDIVIVLLGCFILAFGWFGFNPGSTLGAATSGNLRISSIAVNTMLAGMAGSFGAMYYMWIRYGKPDASMTGNGLLAGLVAITAPSGFVNPMGAVHHRPRSPACLCALSVEFIERVMKLDDVVGAISVHGTNGIWGVISVGLFADGKSNYAGAWNGVPGSVTGLFYGDAGQLVAQLIGVATLIGFVFSFSFVVNMIVEAVWGHRVSAKTELAGLDIPEMGALGYPEFVLKPEPVLARVRRHVHRTRLEQQLRGSSRAADALPPVPWRDPHSVSPRRTGGLHPAARSGLPGEPAVGGPAHVPRHGARRELRRLQVDGRARRRARPSIRRTSGRSSSTRELHYRLRALNRAEEETRRAADLADEPVSARRWRASRCRRSGRCSTGASATSSGPSR